YVKDFFKYKTILNGVFKEDQGIVKSQCEGYLQYNLKDYLVEKDTSFIKLCANISSHITNIKSDPNINKSAFCEYTNYWLYDTLKSTQKEITNYKALLRNFFQYLYNFEDCIEHNAEAIDEHIYINLKKLDELYEKFYIFKNKSSTQDILPCDKGKECVQDYKSHKITCMGNGNNSFCNELEYFRGLFNSHLKSETKCNDIKELPSFQGSPLAATISLPVSVMSAISFFSFITY
ncbi:hypothetical protein PCYB_007860, partial [Plasmodium cynomolgi strain B]